MLCSFLCRCLPKVINQWWSEFRDTFAGEKDYQTIIWNNKEIKIDKKPVYFNNYHEAGITYTHDLRFDWDVNVAFSHLSNKINKTNYLQWAGLRHSLPSPLRLAKVPFSTLSPSFRIENNTFDIKQKRSKDYYSLLVSRKAQHPNITFKLQRDFGFTIDQINQIFLLPHSVALESYVKASQYKVINSIFYNRWMLSFMPLVFIHICTQLFISGILPHILSLFTRFYFTPVYKPHAEYFFLSLMMPWIGESLDFKRF